MLNDHDLWLSEQLLSAKYHLSNSTTNQNHSHTLHLHLSLSLSQVICHDLRHHLTTSSLDYLFYTQLCHSYTHQTCAADNYYKFLYHATTDIL